MFCANDKWKETGGVNGEYKAGAGGGAGSRNLQFVFSIFLRFTVHLVFQLLKLVIIAILTV